MSVEFHGNRPAASAHRQAYEHWKTCRSFNGVADKLGLNYRTIRPWIDKDFPCPWGCQWHGWEELLAQENEIIQQKMKDMFATDSGTLDPANPNTGISFARDVEIKVTQHRLAIVEMIRSDVERLTHLEMIYGMIFYRMTGIKLDSGIITDVNGIQLTFDELYQRIPDFKTLDGALNALAKVLQLIDIHRTRAGLVADNGAGKTKEEVQEEEAEKSVGKDDELSLEDLRFFKELVEKTPPEKRAALKAMWNSEMRATNAIVN